MRRKQGFTLTEILLAVMIVGIIGVALASLTTTATRETTTGRSRITLRNSLSLALRQIRQDIHESNQVLYVNGVIDTVGSNAIPLLVLSKNARMFDDSRILADSNAKYDPKYIAYCFVPGGTTKLSSGANVLPANAKDGGKIYRGEFPDKPYSSESSLSVARQVCKKLTSATGNFKILLHNVKFIPPSEVTADNYPVPFFGLKDYTNTRKASGLDFFTIPEGHVRTIYGNDIASRLYVHLIVELPVSPVVNEVAEEMFALPNGFEDIGD